MEPTRCSLIPNDVLEGSKKIKKLGEGANGPVYLVETRQGSFAVKKQYIPEGRDPGLLNESLVELDALVRLRHVPQVVQVQGICINQPNLSILIEVMDGNLQDFIRKTLAVERILRLDEFIKPMLEVLALFAESNLYHYDIKPENILYKITVKGILFKVSDFGLASVKFTRLSYHDVYTLYYRPPEYLVNRDRKTFDKNPGDVWAMGLTILEFIIGHPVFHSQHEYGMIDEIHEYTGDKLSHDEFVEQVKEDKYNSRNPHLSVNEILRRYLYKEDRDLIGLKSRELLESMLLIPINRRASAAKLLQDYYNEQINPEILLPPNFPRRVSERGIRVILGLKRENLIPTLIAIELYTRFLGTLSSEEMFKLDEDKYPFVVVTIALRYLDEWYDTRNLLKDYETKTSNPQFISRKYEEIIDFAVDTEIEILTAVDFLIYNLRLTPFTEPEYLEKILQLPMENYLRPIEEWFN